MTDQQDNPQSPGKHTLRLLFFIALLSASSAIGVLLAWAIFVAEDPADRLLLFALFGTAAILIPLSIIAVVRGLRNKHQHGAVEPGSKRTWEYERTDIDRQRVVLWIAFVFLMALGGISQFVIPHFEGARTPVPGTRPAQAAGAPQDRKNALSPASGVIAAATLSPAEAQFRTSGAIATDGVNLYAADSRGNKIRKIVIATGVETTLAGSGAPGADDGIGAVASFNYPTGIAVEGGNLFVSDTASNKIRRVAIATGEVSTIAGSGAQGHADGAGAAASFNYPGGIATDGASLYVSDSNSRIIRKIVLSTGQVTTLAGSGAPGAVDGAGSAASFDSPRGLAFHGGNLYVADGDAEGNARIRKIAVATGTVTTLPGMDAGMPLGSSIGIAAAGDSLYMADGRGNQIVKIAIATGAITAMARGLDETHAGKARVYTSAGIATDGKNLYAGDDRKGEIDKIVIATGELSCLQGPGTWTAFDNPAGIASDGNNLYVADSGNNMIRKIDMAAGTVSTLAGWGGKGIKDAKGAAALFNYPMGIAAAGGSLYVADTNNNLIRKIVLATGEVSTLAGSGATGAKDGMGAAASFNYPAGIAAEGGNLYVADSDNHVIRKIAAATGTVTTLAGSGAKGFRDGAGKAASFSSPRGVFVDRGSLYVADAYNNAVRKIALSTGVVTTVAGTGSQGAVDAAGKGASFRLPSGIAVDGDNLYLADTNNQTIRRIGLSTADVTTLGGSGTVGANDGSGKLAAFAYPFGIVAEGGNLYVADSQNNKIRKVAISTGAVTTIAAPGNQAVADGSGKTKAADVPHQQDVDASPQDEGGDPASPKKD